jgi:hypothetical protein
MPLSQVKQHPAENARLLTQAGITMGMPHGELAELLGTTRRTFSRWAQKGTWLSIEHAVVLARLVHRRDRVAAARFAELGDTTLVALGLEAPPAPAPSHLGSAVVCAAAEAIDASPRAVRPGLLAAVRCARELGLDLAKLEALLAPEKD